MEIKVYVKGVLEKGVTLSMWGISGEKPKVIVYNTVKTAFAAEHEAVLEAIDNLASQDKKLVIYSNNKPLMQRMSKEKSITGNIEYRWVSLAESPRPLLALRDMAIKTARNMARR